MLLISSERCLIFSPDIRKDLFVALNPCRLKSHRKEEAGYSLSSASKVNIGTDDTDMIESVGVSRKWGHALKPNDCLVAATHGDMKNVASRESRYIRTFSFDAEWCVE